mmetsp:Transcript_44552/g.85222  ORF Transcript_44552/g.85222 Transcript_44552/m.85222 type:complete len:220 (-) Transcript_44552:149-808(-)
MNTCSSLSAMHGELDKAPRVCGRFRRTNTKNNLRGHQQYPSSSKSESFSLSVLPSVSKPSCFCMLENKASMSTGPRSSWSESSEPSSAKAACAFLRNRASSAAFFGTTRDCVVGTATGATGSDASNGGYGAMPKLAGGRCCPLIRRSISISALSAPATANFKICSRLGTWYAAFHSSKSKSLTEPACSSSSTSAVSTAQASVTSRNKAAACSLPWFLSG